MTDQIVIFIELIKKALDKVDKDYYGRKWWNETILKNLEVEYEKDGLDSVEILKNYLDSFGERVFCYELYYQTRKLMEDYELENHNFFNDVKLQGELHKKLIDNTMERFFHKKALESKFIPDFLLHMPSSFEKQLLIIEVKSNPDISFNSIKLDLLKIQQFIERYDYHIGIFLTVNSNAERISKMLIQENNLEWIDKNIKNKKEIIIMCKEYKGAELIENTIQSLFI